MNECENRVVGRDWGSCTKRTQQKKLLYRKAWTSDISGQPEEEARFVFEPLPSQLWSQSGSRSD